MVELSTLERVWEWSLEFKLCLLSLHCKSMVSSKPNDLQIHESTDNTLRLWIKWSKFDPYKARLWKGAQSCKCDQIQTNNHSHNQYKWFKFGTPFVLGEPKDQINVDWERDSYVRYHIIKVSIWYPNCVDVTWL